MCGNTHVPNPTPKEFENFFEPKEPSDQLDICGLSLCTWRVLWVGDWTYGISLLHAYISGLCKIPSKQAQTSHQKCMLDIMSLLSVCEAYIYVYSPDVLYVL